VKPSEFIERLTYLAKMRGVDAGPFSDYGAPDGHRLEVYSHLGDDMHASPGVYVWEAGGSEPTMIEPAAFDNVIAHVDALPLDLESFNDPMDGAEWPGAAVFVWRAITRANGHGEHASRVFKAIGVLSAQQHANLAMAELCDCEECREHAAVDATIVAILNGKHT
jgi:hypothetical protein